MLLVVLNFLWCPFWYRTHQLCHFIFLVQPQVTIVQFEHICELHAISHSHFYSVLRPVIMRLVGVHQNTRLKVVYDVLLCLQVLEQCHLHINGLLSDDPELQLVPTVVNHLFQEHCRSFHVRPHVIVHTRVRKEDLFAGILLWIGEHRNKYSMAEKIEQGHSEQLLVWHVLAGDFAWGPAFDVTVEIIKEHSDVLGKLNRCDSL
mmetsp:Transcript_98918/g.171405  ORF Transcript_98918/g.171405 Transcript_98918/m.171405 type:complete len:204 (-) Transcript_98918:1252-1863(-)